MGVPGCEVAAPGAEEGGESESESGTGGFEEAELADRCSAAPSVSTGLWPGNLRGAGVDAEGACEMGGPDVFAKVALPYAADLVVEARGVGFVPRVSVLPASCTEGRSLGCGEGIPLALHDVPAGAELYVAVGIAPDDPALLEPPPSAGEVDGLTVELDLLVRRILEDGDYCQPPGVGRCRTGSACLADAEDGVFRCEVLVADTCASAERVDLPALTEEPVVLEIDPTDLHSDAHQHACFGSRVREAVYRLALSPETSATADVIVSTTATDVGMALRSPGCLSTDEIACSEPGPPASVTFPNAGEVSAQGVEPMLFVELPDPPPDGEPADPISVEIEVVDG